jgi:hypothetical protein
MGSYIKLMELDKLKPGIHVIQVRSFKDNKKWGRIVSDPIELRFER